MTNRRIVYTRFDGGVSVYRPVPKAIAWMSCGGYWADRPRGFLQEQIRRQIEMDKRDPDAARRFAMALQFGGCSEAEAWAILRDRDCLHRGTDLALQDASDLPDRWFRDAWVRGHNGGVTVDLTKSRPIQWRKIKAAEKAEKLRREMSLNDWRRPIKVPWLTVERAIKNARDPDEIRKVWPECLPS